MKTKLLIILPLLLAAAVVAVVCWPFDAYAATCSPTGLCKVCSNCSSCGHCAKQGGSCSVCRRR
jgi:hypothetical protein